MKKILLASIIAIMGLNASAQTEVGVYQPGVTENGITYFLPQTGLHLTITATRTTHIPGEYCRYAERYMRLNNVPQETYDTWTIESVEITPFGQADKTKAYSIKLKNKTSAPLVSLAPDGRLLAVNANAQPLPALSIPKVTDIKSDYPNPQDYKTEEILSAGSTAKMAELTANEIYDIRESRSMLTKGQADYMPKDGEQLKLMLTKLDVQEEALLMLFKGTEKQQRRVFTLDYVPSSAVSKGIIFRFSKYFGLVPSDDLSGEPVYISIADLHSLPSEAATADGGNKKKEVEDLRYIVPGNALVKIFNSTTTFSSQEIPMSQFGKVEHLGGELFNKKATTHVLLSPETGGIVKIDAANPD